ncbi:MAG: TetR/AcrR family transcriptional regulator [Myxococcota bacterium]
MPLQRFSKLDSGRQGAILGAARAEFAARGYAAASYNTIIREAGLSKGAMYYYFADKADLCRTVLDSVLSQLGEAAGELGDFDDAPGFWAEVRGLSERALAFMFAMPEVADLGRLLYDERGSGEVLAPLVARAEQWCVELLRSGQRVGAVRSDLRLDFLGAAIVGLLVHTDRWFAQNLHTIADAELRRLSDVCLHMVEQLAAPVR